MLLEPDILLMDEPTKGLDAEFKQSFAAMVRSLLSGGVTVLMVSHDVEFCARYAHRCALFFDGSISAEERPVPSSAAAASTPPPPTAWPVGCCPMPSRRRTS